MKFRLHRGSLEESMKTVVEIKSPDELRKVIQDNTPWLKGEPIIDFVYAGWDQRVGWDTFYVTVRGPIDTGPHVVGMSDGLMALT